MASPRTDNAAIDGLRAEHERNEAALASLRAEVDRVTSPPASKPTSPDPAAASASGTTAGKDEERRPSSSRSPVNLASALFSRGKPKGASKSSSKTKGKSGSGGGSSSGSRTPVNGNSNSNNANAGAGPSPEADIASAEAASLASEIRRTQESENRVVSSAIGLSAPGTALNERGDDDVLDLADQLLAQLDAKSDGNGGSHGPASYASGALPASGTASAQGQGVPIIAPQPTAVPAATPAHVPSSGSTNSGSNPARMNSSMSSLSSSTNGGGSNGLGFGSKARHASSSSNSSPKLSFGAKLKEAFSPPGGHSSSHANANASANGSAVAEDGSGPSPGPHKNRHALKKERKKAEEDRIRAEAQAEVEAQRAAGIADPAAAERQAMSRLLRMWNLEVCEMDPDGHCMYSAVADQLCQTRVLKKADYKTTRKAAAEYMREHMDDFLPYLPAEDIEGQGEGLLSKEGYEKHCDNVENTAEWGSHTELLALSKYFKVPIYVIQGGSQAVKIGMEEPWAKKATPLTISYHRHSWGLGEHYNSLRPAARDAGFLAMGSVG